MTELLQSLGQPPEVDVHTSTLGSELSAQVAGESYVRENLVAGANTLLGFHEELSPTDGDQQSLGADVPRVESVDSVDRARPA